MRDRRDITWPSLLGVAGAYGPPAGAFVAAIKQCGAVLAMHFPPRALKAQRAAGQRLCKSIHSVLVAITEGRVRRVSLLGPLKALRPMARSMIDAQNLNDISLQSIGDNKGRLGNDELARARDAARAPHLRIVGR